MLHNVISIHFSLRRNQDRIQNIMESTIEILENALNLYLFQLSRSSTS